MSLAATFGMIFWALPLLGPSEEPGTRPLFTERTGFVVTDRGTPAIEAALRGAALDAHHRPRSDLPLWAAGVSPGQTIADIGCGRGRISLLLADRVGEDGRVFCRDVSESGLGELRRQAEQDARGNMDISVSATDDVRLPESSIDVALLADVYQIVLHSQEETRTSFLRSIYRAMRPNGIVVVCYARMTHLKQPDRNETFYRRTIEDFVAAGFEVGRTWRFPEESFPAQVFEFRRPQDERHPAPALRRHVVASDGHPLTVWSKTPRDARSSILLVHGRTWSALPDFDLQVGGEQRSLMDALAAREFATYAIDLRGYGGTPRDDTGWLSPDKAARDVSAALRWVAEHDDLDVKPVLFGWSMGATVAELSAGRDVDLISALVLFGYWRDPDQDTPQEDDLATPERARTTAAAAASDFVVPGVISAAAIDTYVRMALAADPVRVDWRRMHQWNALDPARITVPTLLLQAELDPYADTQAHSRLFTGLGTPDRSWVVLAGVDHAALLEDSLPEFADAVAAFVRRSRR